MLLLAIDTSGKQGGIALARTLDQEIEIIETAPLAGGTFSAQLIPQIAELLARRNLTRHQIDAFAVAAGPGSFTGLRIGLAAVKALAEVLHKPIAAVSLLQVCAQVAADESGLRGNLLSALDAGRGDVYVGKYKSPADPSPNAQEEILTRTEFLTRARSFSVVTPDAAIAEAATTAGLQVLSLPPITAAAVARLGWRKLQSGQTVTPERLEANYIRRTDAEMLERSKP